MKKICLMLAVAAMCGLPSLARAVGPSANATTTVQLTVDKYVAVSIPSSTYTATYSTQASGTTATADVTGIALTANCAAAATVGVSGTSAGFTAVVGAEDVTTFAGNGSTTKHAEVSYTGLTATTAAGVNVASTTLTVTVTANP